MHRIMKSSSQSFSYEPEPVAIDNSVVIRQRVEPLPASEDNDEFVELSETLKAENERINREEQKHREEIDAAAEEKIAEEKKLYEEKKKQLDDETAQIIANVENEAKARAAEIISAAITEAEEMRQKARADGYAQGEQKGLDAAAKYTKAAAELISGIEARKEAYFLSARDELIETSIYIAEKLIAAELSTDKKAIFSIAAQAAKDFRNSEHLKISLAGADVSEEIVADKEFIRSIASGIPDIELEVLPNAESGTVVLDNGSEIVDASVPTQLDLLKEIMENSKRKKD